MSEINFNQYERELLASVASSLERPVVRLVLPPWVATVAGVLLILGICLLAIVVAQARQIDLLSQRLSIFETELIAEQKKREEDEEKLAHQRRVIFQLACQLDVLSAAARGSWGQAYVLLRSGALEGCGEPVPILVAETPGVVPNGGGQD